MNKTGGLPLPDLQANYKAIMMKITWYQYKKSPESRRNPGKHMVKWFQQGCQDHSKKKRQLLTKWMRTWTWTRSLTVRPTLVQLGKKLAMWNAQEFPRCDMRPK